MVAVKQLSLARPKMGTSVSGLSGRPNFRLGCVLVSSVMRRARWCCLLGRIDELQGVLACVWTIISLYIDAVSRNIDLMCAVANVLSRVLGSATTLPCQNALARSIFHQAASSVLVIGCADKRSTSCDVSEGGTQGGRAEGGDTQISLGRLLAISNSCRCTGGPSARTT